MSLSKKITAAFLSVLLLLSVLGAVSFSAESQPEQVDVSVNVGNGVELDIDIELGSNDDITLQSSDSSVASAELIGGEEEKSILVYGEKIGTASVNIIDSGEVIIVVNVKVTARAENLDAHGKASVGVYVFSKYDEEISLDSSDAKLVSVTKLKVNDKDDSHSILVANQPKNSYKYDVRFSFSKSGNYSINIVGGKSGKMVEVKANITSHQLGELVVDVNPSCDRVGKGHRVCSVCGESVVEDIAALRHVPDEPVRENETKITATSGGTYDKVTYCKNCGAELERIKVTVEVTDKTKKKTDKSTEKAVKQKTHFSPLKLRQSSAKAKSVKISWSNVSKAAKYAVYGAKSSGKFKKLATVTAKSYTHKKLKKGTYYKYYVTALSKKGKKLATAETVYITTTGGKYSNEKNLSVSGGKLSIKVGDRVTVLSDIKSSSKVKKFRDVCFESSNTKYVTVTNKGRIDAVKKGSAEVYIFLQNGIYSTIKVTVK